MTKEIEIGGCVEVPMEVSCDEFIDEFIAFVESKGWCFGGGFKEIIDGYYMNPDGSRGKHVLDDLYVALNNRRLLWKPLCKQRKNSVI